MNIILSVISTVLLSMSLFAQDSVICYEGNPIKLCVDTLSKSNTYEFERGKTLKIDHHRKPSERTFVNLLHDGNLLLKQDPRIDVDEFIKSSPIEFANLQQLHGLKIKAFREFTLHDKVGNVLLQEILPEGTYLEIHKFENNSLIITNPVYNNFTVEVPRSRIRFIDSTGTLLFDNPWNIRGFTNVKWIKDEAIGMIAFLSVGCECRDDILIEATKSLGMTAFEDKGCYRSMQVFNACGLLQSHVVKLVDMRIEQFMFSDDGSSLIYRERQVGAKEDNLVNSYDFEINEYQATCD